VYPIVNYRTWGNNELSYVLPPPGMEIIGKRDLYLYSEKFKD